MVYIEEDTSAPQHIPTKELAATYSPDDQKLCLIGTGKVPDESQIIFLQAESTHGPLIFDLVAWIPKHHSALHEFKWTQDFHPIPPPPGDEVIIKTNHGMRHVPVQTVQGDHVHPDKPEPVLKSIDTMKRYVGHSHITPRPPPFSLITGPDPPADPADGPLKAKDVYFRQSLVRLSLGPTAGKWLLKWHVDANFLEFKDVYWMNGYMQVTFVALKIGRTRVVVVEQAAAKQRLHTSYIPINIVKYG